MKLDNIGELIATNPFQALLLALSSIGVELEVFNKELGGKLRWECGEKKGVGIPAIHPSLL